MAAHACALAVAPCLHYAILFLSLPHFEEMQATQNKNIIYFKSVLRWEPANATRFSLRTRVLC